MNAVTRPNRDPRFDPERVARAPHGPELHCKSWLTEAAYRMIQNNLDPDVAEDPERLVVYGSIGRAARDWRPLFCEGKGPFSWAALSGDPEDIYKTDAGYELAVATAKQQGLKLPMIGE